MDLPDFPDHCYWCGETQHHDVQPPWGVLPWASGRVMVPYYNGATDRDDPVTRARYFSCGTHCIVSLLDEMPSISFSNPDNRCSRNMKKQLDRQREALESIEANRGVLGWSVAADWASAALAKENPS